MKRVLLNRHAKAESSIDLADYDRPLADDGSMQAKRLGQELLSCNIIPDAWICSTALRANSTAVALLREMNLENIIKEVPDVYEATAAELLQVINEVTEEYNFVAVTGHNPGISHLLTMLCNEVRDVPPCTAILIDFEADNWSAVSAGTGSITWYRVP